MKGTIIICLRELVEGKFGKDKWANILKEAGVPDLDKGLTTFKDIDEAIVGKLFNATCKILGISFQQAADAFGDYWVNVYSQKYYKPYYMTAKNAKDFLLKMDEVHQKTTQALPGSKPPRFDYEMPDDKTLIMKYKSHRNLIDVLVGLIKGVGKFYKENLQVRKIGNDKVEIKFS
ncbi:MAG: heme NO-binding domain-containing protein [Candidatus Aenigmatarchaeota archaeon]|uniref:Heme NO-binding domain-containing protein n=1 Tax=Caldimicrobium thiodismutans TaxID=1653476 RepID=A0A832LVZ2_9BACT